MNTSLRSLAEAQQRRLEPALLLPATMSFFAAVLAWALASAEVRSVATLEVVTALQAALMLSGAAVIAGAHVAAQDCWRRRVAPSAALQRVRRSSVKMLAHLAVRGLVGPLLMAASLAWLRLDWDVLAMTAGVLLSCAAALLVGSVLGASLQPRVAAWVAMARRPRSTAAWRWFGGSRRWRRVATQQEIDMAQRGGALWMWFALVPQSLLQAPHWRFHAWGNSLASGTDIAWAVLWMTILGLIVNAVVIGPPLHWRARLAPGGLSAAGWARRMVAGSLLNATVWVSAVLALSMAVSGPDTRAVQITAWVPVVGDALLATALVLWMRGLRNSGLRQTLSGFGLGVATGLSLGAVRVLGFTPQRGAALLLVELALALTFAVAAQRAWARQDLNRLVPRP